MPVEVKIKRYDTVVVTAENEAAVLAEEFDRRYGDTPFDLGETVQFTANGRAHHLEMFGLEHVGKRAVVTGFSEGGDVKVLAISTAGEFVETYAPLGILTRV